MKVAGREAAAQAEWTQALVVVEKGLSADPNRAALLRYRALLFALLGRKEEGEKWWKVVWEMPREISVNTPCHSAEFYTVADMTEEAIRWLERAHREKIPFWQRTGVRFDPMFAAVRGDPRVQRMFAEWEAEIDALRAQRVTPPNSNSKSQPSEATRTPTERRESGPSYRGATQNSEPSRLAADAKSVAVLAFTNSSDDKSNEYFSDGISEELLNVLAKVPGLKVSARTSLPMTPTCGVGRCIPVSLACGQRQM